MANTISPSHLSPSPHKPTLFSVSSSLLPRPRRITNYLLSVPQLSLGLSSPWTGLRHLGVPTKLKFIRIERKEKNNDKVVHASLFGVGAPEVLVIGVVALLVFGPKGLAEVARTLGKTLRAFQPTIRELQDVSKEFKNTLEREIGLDDVPPPVRDTTSTKLDPNGIPLTGEILESKKEELEAIVAQTTPGEHSENQSHSQVQDGAEPAATPFNIGHILVEAQKRSYAEKQALTVSQESHSELESQPVKQEQTTLQESPSEPESQAESQEQPTLQESQSELESQPKGEVNSMFTPPEMSETEK